MKWLRRGLLTASAALALMLVVQPSLPQKQPPPVVLEALAAAPGIAPRPAGPLNLNTAPLEELEALDGIGPHIAGLIVAHRSVSPFRYVEDLRLIPGIGERRLEQIRPFVYVEEIQ